MRVVLVTPARSGTLTGNRITAQRWEGILRELGCDVTIAEEWTGALCDVLVALHARHSHASIVRFKRERPGDLLVVALTGTDLYQDLAVSGQAQESLDFADRLVVLQPAACDALPLSARGKAVVIFQSAERVGPRGPRNPEVFEVCVIGHLRDVKDPFRAAEAVRRLPPDSRIVVTHLGAALEEGMELRARAEAAANPRYRWLGERSRDETLSILRGSRLMALTSRLEGGANALSEAIVAEVPVVSSRIDGSVGILGADYPGFFPFGDTAALSALMRRAETDRAFLRDLARRCAALEPLFSRKRERTAWAALLRTR